jgi:hypothetical protein
MRRKSAGDVLFPKSHRLSFCCGLAARSLDIASESRFAFSAYPPPSAFRRPASAPKAERREGENAV